MLTGMTADLNRGDSAAGPDMYIIFRALCSQPAELIGFCRLTFLGRLKRVCPCRNSIFYLQIQSLVYLMCAMVCL